jgi:hypothetical protein
MDAPDKGTSPTPPKKKWSLARLFGISFLILLCIGIVAAIAIRTKNQGDKQRNLEETRLQELKQPQKIAFDAIAADSSAKEALGDDIKDEGGLSREGSGELDRTATIIHFDVAGSKAKGRVTAHAAFQQGAWQVTEDIQVDLKGGQKMKVPKPGDKPPDIDLGF